MCDKATKRPWKATPFDDGWIRDANNHAVCMVDGLEERDLIVRAVNDYDRLIADKAALVEALEWAIEMLDEHGGVLAMYTRRGESALAALEAARGE